jgi:hypothetical protein
MSLDSMLYDLIRLEIYPEIYEFSIKEGKTEHEASKIANEAVKEEFEKEKRRVKHNLIIRQREIIKKHNQNIKQHENQDLNLDYMMKNLKL